MIVTTAIVELNDELSRFIQSVADKRQVSLECAALQILEEERMRSLGITRSEVSVYGERWAAKMPTRGLVYAGRDVEWMRLNTHQQTISETV
jgi:hypothetical protein